jgi:hypothetical protein
MASLWALSLFSFFLFSFPIFGQEGDLSPAPSFWDKTLDVRLAGGFKDNLLLSHNASEASAFILSGLDLIILRLPVDGTQFSFFLSGEDTHYLSGKLVDKEQSLIALTQLKRDFTEHWQAGIELQYLYQDQVFDASTTETVGIVRAQGHGLSGRPTLRRAFSKKSWLDLNLPITRQFFKLPLDGYWEGGARLSFGEEYGEKSEVTCSYEIKRRFYDHREQITAAGAILPRTSLEFNAHEFSMANRHHWDKARRWRSTTKVALELNEDNGSGYFDYRKYQVGEQLRYRASTWEIQGQLKFNYYDYSVQRVSQADVAKRDRTGFLFALRAEKNITKSLKCFANYEHESVMSNRAFDAYQVNTISGGLEQEF